MVKIETENIPNQLQEPFGWAKGTIRGMITIFMTITFCVLCIAQRIPWEIAGSVFSAVILSYFVQRASISSK